MYSSTTTQPLPMSESVTRVGVWMVALICILTGISSVFYGYIAIYSLSGFTSIFIGVAIILISIGLLKRHAVARIGAYIVLIISGTGCLMWLYFFQQNAAPQQKYIGLTEYFCLIYIVLAIAAIVFLSVPVTRRYFSN